MTPQVRARLSSDVLRTLAIVISENSPSGSDPDRELLDCVRRIAGDAILNIAGANNYSGQRMCLDIFQDLLQAEIIPEQDRALAEYWATTDDRLADLICRDDSEARRALIGRTRPRLLRLAHTILGDDREAETVLDQAYSISFAALPGLHLDIPVDEWLVQRTLIAARQARDRTSLYQRNVIKFQDQSIASLSREAPPANLDTSVTVIESSVNLMPEDQRLVFILQGIDGLSAEACAKILKISPSAVRTRYFLAIDMIARSFQQQLTAALRELFNANDEQSVLLNRQILKRLSLLINPAQRSIVNSKPKKPRPDR